MEVASHYDHPVPVQPELDGVMITLSLPEAARLLSLLKEHEALVKDGRGYVAYHEDATIGDDARTLYALLASVLWRGRKLG